METKYCSNCGTQIASSAQYCENCGSRQGSVSNAGYQEQQYQQRPVYQQKSPGLAALLSFLIVGLVKCITDR